MKVLNLSLFICLLFSICSCGEEDVLTSQDINNQPLSITNDSTFFRTEAEAVFSAINTLSEMYPNDNRVSQRPKSLKIKNVNHIKNSYSTSTNSPGFYIINFDGGGFAMISNDTRATEVYAYSNEGNLNLGSNNNVDYYLSLANDYLNYEIANSNRASFIPITPAPSDPENPEHYALVLHGDHYCHKMPINEVITGSFEYLLKTEWSQGTPYNNLCLASTGARVEAGCVAIALGQIMAYHKKPLSYNGHTYPWDLITQYPIIMPSWSVAQSVAELIHDIGVSAGIDYWNGSSGTNINGARNALSDFGYNHVMSNYSYNIITNNIDSGRPCYTQGDNNTLGHAWVIDGYRSISTTYKYYTQTTLELCYIGIETLNYVHCNWGWGGTSNGFFLEKAFSNIDGNDFSKNLKIIHDIYQ